MVDLLPLDTLYENEILQIQLNKSYSLLQLTFRQHPDPDHFKNGYRLAIDTALRKETAFWLTDARQIKAMLPENQAWLLQNMSPHLKAARIKKFAILMAPECFVMTNPNQVYNRPAQTAESPAAGSIKVHFDLTAAYNWLFNID